MGTRDQQFQRIEISLASEVRELVEEYFIGIIKQLNSIKGDLKTIMANQADLDALVASENADLAAIGSRARSGHCAIGRAQGSSRTPSVAASCGTTARSWIAGSHEAAAQVA